MSCVDKDDKGDWIHECKKDKRLDATFPPAETPEERLAFKQQGICPDCGHQYLWSGIPWNGGSCVNTDCKMHDRTQLRHCAICKQPRYRCSC